MQSGARCQLSENARDAAPADPAAKIVPDIITARSLAKDLRALPTSMRPSSPLPIVAFPWRQSGVKGPVASFLAKRPRMDFF